MIVNGGRLGFDTGSRAGTSQGINVEPGASQDWVLSSRCETIILKFLVKLKCLGNV